MENGGGGIIGAIGGLFSLIIIILMIVSMWKVFTKAGKPGWACLIPFYNIIVMLQIAGKPGWWLLLFLIPVVNFIIAIITLLAFAANFGKGGGFVAGLIFLPFIFWPLLAFGDARYSLR
jgi:uncharacterized membrane protein YhaH (DUF805 family)